MATPEQKARELIDEQLSAAGWVLEDRDGITATQTYRLLAEVPIMTASAQFAAALAARLTNLLEQFSPEEAATWMAEIAQDAEMRGWTDNVNALRRDPWSFAQDLFVDNPLAGDLIALRAEFVCEPDQVDDIRWFCDYL